MAVGGSDIYGGKDITDNAVSAASATNATSKIPLGSLIWSQFYIMPDGSLKKETALKDMPDCLINKIPDDFDAEDLMF